MIGACWHDHFERLQPHLVLIEDPGHIALKQDDSTVRVLCIAGSREVSIRQRSAPIALNPSAACSSSCWRESCLLVGARTKNRKMLPLTGAPDAPVARPHQQDFGCPRESGQ